MFLVELVLQGVRGFREHARLRFKGGFNLVAAGNESGKTTAIDSVQRLLFPSDRAELFEALVSRYAPDTSRAALVTCSDEGAYNRMIQDFSKRAVNLSQYNPTSKDFSILHRDWNNAVQFMAGMTAGTSEEDFARIFIFRREHYATGSRQSAPVPASKAAPAMPAPPEKGRSSTNKERIAELREILRKAEEAADAEYRFESAKLAREEITKKINSLDEIKQQKTAIQSTLESLKMYEAMPENLIELIDDQEKRQGQKLVDADELNKQIEGMKMQLAEMPTVNFIMDKLFISGVLMVIASIIAGVFVLTDELRILFPVGLVLALILMVGAWYKESRLGTRRKNITKEEEKLKAELNKLETRFLQEGATITTLMRSTAASSLADLKEKSANYRSALSFRDDIEEQETRSLGDKTLESLLQQQEEMQQEVAKLEQAAQAVAEYNMDTYSIRQEIELMDSSTSIASAGEAWDFGAESQEQVPIAPNVISSDQGGGFLDDLAIACRIAGIEMETLVPSVEAAAQRNLASITEGKYVKIEAGRESGPVVHDKDNSIVDHSELSHGTRNLITFCLRAGLVEALAGKRRFPFLLDDPFADFDPARQKAACQILRSLGAKTQVILFTSDPSLTAEGDTVVEFQ